jgi:AraC-like DNA-binding protein
MKRTNLSGRLVYHTGVNALEGKAGWTPQKRFTAAVMNCISGHVPYERYVEAGRVLEKAKPSEGYIERVFRDWTATDVNPGCQILFSFSKLTQVIDLYNKYNLTVNLGVKTRAAHDGVEKRTQPLKYQRLSKVSEDSEICRFATFTGVNIIAASVARNEREKLARPIRNLSELSVDLGIKGSVGDDVARVFETEGAIPINLVALKIGCHQRTLERELRKNELTAESIRMSVRLIEATKLLSSPKSLADIAVEVGYSDQAHMARAFRLSTGMPPSIFRSVLSK